MSPNLISVKSFLGKYYQELAYSAIQDKYVNTNLDRFFEQKFHIQGNKAQMIVDPSLEGLIITVLGNEIYVSKDLYDHPNIEVVNSMENRDKFQSNPRSLYNPEIFSTLSYLVCQNHTMFRIVGGIDEPIYIKYKSDYETFYNSVVVFNISGDIDVEIVEEFESNCALNSVINYILQPNSKLNLSTFYQNNMAALSFCLRSVIVQDYAKYSHILLGKGSSTIIDESKIYTHHRSSTELLGCISPSEGEFHTIVGIHPAAQDYDFSIDHRHILDGEGITTFTPIVIGHLPADSHTDISSLIIDDLSESERITKTAEFLLPIIQRATLERNIGSGRFYSNKSKFLQF